MSSGGDETECVIHLRLSASLKFQMSYLAWWKRAIFCYLLHAIELVMVGQMEAEEDPSYLVHARRS